MPQATPHGAEVKKHNAWWVNLWKWNRAQSNLHRILTTHKFTELSVSFRKLHYNYTVLFCKVFDLSEIAAAKEPIKYNWVNMTQEPVAHQVCVVIKLWWEIHHQSIHLHKCIKVKVKVHTAVNGTPISQLWDITCHMGSHSVTCHLTHVNAPAPHLNPSQ